MGTKLYDTMRKIVKFLRIFNKNSFANIPYGNNLISNLTKNKDLYCSKLLSEINGVTTYELIHYTMEEIYPNYDNINGEKVYFGKILLRGNLNDVIRGNHDGN